MLCHSITEVWKEVEGVGKVFDVRAEFVTLERKDANELNERISREKLKSVKHKLKNCETTEPDDMPGEFYKDGGEVVIHSTTTF